VNIETTKEIAKVAVALNLLEIPIFFTQKNWVDIDFCKNVIKKIPDAVYIKPDIFEYFIEQTNYLEKPLSVKLPKGLVHGDLFPDNTMFKGNKLLSILDFEVICIENLLHELGTAINGFCYVDNKLSEELLHVFLNEYQKHYKLNETEKKLLPAYMQWGAHCMIAWHIIGVMEHNDTKKYKRKVDMSNTTKCENESDSRNEQVRWVIDPISMDKLRIIPGHDKAANWIVPVILEALKTTGKVIFAAGGESGTGKSEIAYLVREILKGQGISTVEWSFDNAYVTTPEEREKTRAEDYDNNVGLNEMNRPKIEEVMSCFEQDKPVAVPIIIINEDGSRPIKEIILNMADKKVLILDGLYAALIGKIRTDESKATRIIAMNEKKFDLNAQKERGKEELNEHRLKVLERECNAVRSLWPHVTHKISEDWNVTAYTHK